LWLLAKGQLAFVVANVLMGNTIPVGDGLTAAVKRCAAHAGGKHGFLYSLLSLLAVLSRELSSGAHGSMLVGATPRAADDSWRQRLASSALAEPKICMHQGGPGAATDCGEADFMSAGTSFQAVTDIAGGVVGGGAQLCDVADSQDESLVQFYSEVLAFSFFTAAGSNPAAAENSMLPVPFVLLGARRYVSDVSGESSQGGACGTIQQKDWLNQGIPQGAVAANVDGRPATLAASAFVAVASACSACMSGASCDMSANVNNQCDMQRRHLDKDLSLWYQAYEPTMYAAPVQEAFGRVIRRIGTGPWGAGVWYGDSQNYFLAVWLATSLLKGVYLDYYIYDHFCENPGNQCFVLGAKGCSACVARGALGTLVQAAHCGTQSVHDMVNRFKGQTAQSLYAPLQKIPGPPSQVFDALIAEAAF